MTTRPGNSCARLLLLLLPLLLCSFSAAQEDSSVTIHDGGGDIVLQSIIIPPIPHAPFSLTLATEWAKPLNGGGTYTIVNTRQIMRDSAGRIYEERWLLVPKGSNIRSRMSYVQLGDPTTDTSYTCSTRTHVCEMLDYGPSTAPRYQPGAFTSGPLPGGKGFTTHEDLGTDAVAGVVVHGYRDTTTLNPGALGNDRPMVTMREIHYSADLNLNLVSVLDTPSLGRQTFTVTSIKTTEPDPSFFAVPAGYTVVDHRKTAAAASPK